MILEDNAADAEMVKRELRQAALDFRARWVQDKAGFVAALETAAPDLILADYSLPGFDGLSALQWARQRWADVPVIIVSGAIGEEVAIDTLKAGATDYVLKQRLSRLGPVVRRALQEAREVAQRRQAQSEVQQAHEQLQEQAEELRATNDTLRQAQAQLHRLNEELEQRVQERTAQLLQRTRQLQKLTLELSQTEDRERRRMAEILHDDLQQQLAATKFHLGLLRNRARHDVSLQATAAQIDHLLTSAIETSRNLSHELSPAVMHHADIGATLRWLAHQVQVKHGLVVHVQAHGKIYSPSDALKGFLYRAVQELLFNVVKHAKVAQARIRVRRCADYIGLSVSDRGRGFDPEQLRETAGFGLLSIRERIELLGGRMKIKSAAGEGSTFLIIVPAGEEAVTPAPLGGTAAGPHAEERLRVLLADDHEIVRQGLVSLLREEHTIEVVGEAANGREAVDLAARLHPDVVVMDVSMPLIDGHEATRQIKTHLPQTRVIALSMYDEPEKMETMQRAGAERYVLKTAPSEELLAAIRGEVADS